MTAFGPHLARNGASWSPKFTISLLKAPTNCYVCMVLTSASPLTSWRLPGNKGTVMSSSVPTKRARPNTANSTISMSGAPFSSGGGGVSNLGLITDLLKIAGGVSSERSESVDQPSSSSDVVAREAPKDRIAAAALASIKDILTRQGRPMAVAELSKALPEVNPDYLADLLLKADADGELLVRKSPQDGVVVALRR
jgi:hypothetical protein